MSVNMGPKRVYLHVNTHYGMVLTKERTGLVNLSYVGRIVGPPLIFCLLSNYSLAKLNTYLVIWIYQVTRLKN